MATVSIFMQFKFHIGIIRISFVLILECVRISDSTVLRENQYGYQRVFTSFKKIETAFKMFIEIYLWPVT